MKEQKTWLSEKGLKRFPDLMTACDMLRAPVCVSRCVRCRYWAGADFRDPLHTIQRCRYDEQAEPAPLAR